MINPKHPLVKLTNVIDSEKIERSFVALFRCRLVSLRLFSGLFYLQHADDWSDEAVVNSRTENHYDRYFTGESYFQNEDAINPSNLTSLRASIGEEGLETLQIFSQVVACKIEMMKPSSIECIIVQGNYNQSY